MQERRRSQGLTGWLQKQRIGTHLWLVVLPVLVGLVLVIGWAIWNNVQSQRDAQAEDLEHHSDDLEFGIQSSLAGLSSDLTFFSNFLRTDDRFAEYEIALQDNALTIEQKRLTLAPLNNALRAALESRPDYISVSIVDLDGNELARVERSVGTEIIDVFDTRLTTVANEPYLQEGRQLRRSRVWVSPVELRRDQSGVIATPQQPFVRLVTPITAADQTIIALLVIQTDISPTLDIVNEYETDQEGVAYLVDVEGYYLAHNNQPDLSFGRDLNPENKVENPNAEVILSDVSTPKFDLREGDTTYLGTTKVIEPFAAIAGLANPDQWVIVVGEPLNTSQFLLVAENTPLIVIGLMVLGLVALLIPFQRRIILGNLTLVQNTMKQFGVGDLDARLPENVSNEFGDLHRNFNRNAKFVQGMIQGLETSVQARIRDLDITAEISREAAGLRDVPLIMNRTVNRIVERFEFYHAQVFLVDDLRQNAVLVASTNEPGRRLLAKQHKLAVGSQSVIGRVTSLGVTVIAGDTLATDVPWKPNVELPETRSEMALPLKVENVVIGALDIQSTNADAFSQSDIEVFQVLADQLSIAINNARLLEESNRRVEEIAELNARLTEQAWEEFSARKPSNTQVGFRYNLMQIQEESSALTVIGDGNDRTSVPLKIRGLEVGSIETSQTDLNDDDKALIQAVADRIALALDNARLFEETQITLSESRRLYETSRQISSAADLDLDEMYKLVSDQLIFHETLQHSAILIAHPIPSPRANFLEVAYQWSRQGQPFWDKKGQITLIQQGLGGFYQDTPREMLSFANRAEIAEMDIETVKQFAEKLASESLMFMPIVTGMKWFGLMMLSSPSRNAFDGAFMNYALAVADQLAIAIENRRLLDEVQTEARRSQALAEAGQLANQMSGDFQAGVARLFQSVSTPGNFNRWWFGLVETDNTVKKIDASSRNMPDIIPISVQNAVAAAVRLRETILVNDLTIEHPVVGQLNPTSIQLFGKHLAVPVMLGDHVLGALLIGRDEKAVDLSDDDIQLATTLASQLSVAIENQNLFTSIQRQQETLQTTLETMPAGVMLLNSDQQVLLINRRAVDVFGPGIREGFFSKNTNAIFYVDTENPYTKVEFPINTVFATKQAIIENISVMQPDGSRIDLLLNASPVLNEFNQIASVVAVFQEITELRELEKALHASLSETTILYEASKSILGATATEDIGPALIGQMKHLEADELYLILESTDELEILPPSVSVSMPPLPVEEPIVSDIPLPGELLMPAQQLLISNMEDADIDPNIAAAALEANVKSLSATPLVARGQTLGWLVVLYHQPHEFGTEARRFINSLADQTAVSLDSIRLFESTEKALQSVASLYQSSRRVAEAQGVLDVIEITREELLNFDPDRIDLLIQKSAEIVDEMYFAIAWAKEASLEHVPSLPVSSETAEPLTDFDPFNRYEFYIENFLNDDSNSELHDSLYQLDTPYQAVISVPLRVGGRTIGRVGMGFLRPRRFNSDERQLISTLADATAYVVENDLLLEQTQESLEETGVLYQASRTIANAETREEIVEALIDYAASAQVDKTMLISLMSRSWDEPGAVIEITSTWGSDEVASLQGLFFTSDQFPIWEQLATQEIIWYDNIDAEGADISENARMGYQALGIVSVAVVPLRTPTGVIGCVVFGSSEPRKHENREVRIYQSLADQAAVQLENKRLFDQAEFRARQLATAAEVSRAVTSILNLDNLFPRVVDLILDAFDYDHVQIFMVERDNKTAVVRASTGEAGRQLLAIKHSLQVGSSSVIGRVTSQGEPIIALDTTDPEVVHRPNPYLPETRSEMALPIFVQGKVVGALDVQSNRPQAFDQDDIQALTPLVDQLSVAIENARLFELAQRRAEEMQFLFDVTTAAAAETHLDESLKVVIQILLQNIQASASTIFLYDPLAQNLVSQVEARRDLKTAAITVNPNEGGLRLAVGEGIVGWVAQTRQPAMVGDLLTDPRYRQDYTESLSGIYVPLMAGNELIGVLAMESTQYRFFTDDHLRLIQALSNSVSAIISNTQLLDEVQKTNERLREVDQLKTNFLAAMSHELRTPLNSIIGFSRVILKGIDGPVTDMQKQDIQTIHDSGKHLLGLVNDILDQAKIEAGKMELSAEYFDITAVIAGVMSTAQGLIHGKTIRLYTEIEEGLPMAFGDEFRTRQILFNLVSNASKFTKEGSVTVRARVVHKEGIPVPFIEVGVTDTGIGIAEKDYQNLFAAFQQVDNTTTRSVEGTGLGLPLARSLARLQGGDIYFESTVGTGSTFFVSVPLHPLPTEEDAATSQLPQTGILKGLTVETRNGQPVAEVAPQTGGRKILAVDDDIEVIDLYKRYLNRDGWVVIGITEPERVEELAIQHQPEIILLDVNMPNRTGWQVLESLKANAAVSKIPVIICSIDDNRHKSGDLGAANHLIKPFMETDLLKAVRDIEQILKQ